MGLGRRIGWPCSSPPEGLSVSAEPDLRLPDLAARVHRADEPGRGLEQRSRIKGKAFEMASDRAQRMAPTTTVSLGIGDLAPVVGKGYQLPTRKSRMGMMRSADGSWRRNWK